MEKSDNFFIPYGRHQLDEDDIEAVIKSLKSGWLTTGPGVKEFEKAFENFSGSHHAIAVSSGTAALHACAFAMNIGPGDEVIVPTMTFAATANAVVYQGGTPVFADVCPGTLLIDPEMVEKLITQRTKAIIAVDYAGQPCDYQALRNIADRHGIFLVSDSCHALGALYKGERFSKFADLTVFSFHPVKHITTGEGGMVVTDNDIFAKKIKMFRSHGISADHAQRTRQGTWIYEMSELGYNYRITDFQCALGLSQLKKLPSFLDARQRTAKKYNAVLSTIEGIEPLEQLPGTFHAFHLYVVRIRDRQAGISRDSLFKELHKKHIGVNVHYIPVHFHPFYRKNFNTGEGLCPEAEKAYEEILSLPLFPGMTDSEFDYVVASLEAALKMQRHRRTR